MKAILRAKEHHLHELLPSRLLDRHDKVAGPLPSQSQYEEEGGSSVTIRRLSWLFPIPLRPCRHRQHCSKSRRPCDGMETSFLPSKSIDLWVLLWNDESLLLGQENVLKKKKWNRWPAASLRFCWTRSYLLVPCTADLLPLLLHIEVAHVHGAHGSLFDSHSQGSFDITDNFVLEGLVTEAAHVTCSTIVTRRRKVKVGTESIVNLPAS